MADLILNVNGVSFVNKDVDFGDAAVQLALQAGKASGTVTVRMSIDAQDDSTAMLRLGSGYRLLTGDALLEERLHTAIPNNLPWGPTQEDLEELGITYLWQGIELMQQRDDTGESVCSAEAWFALTSYLQLMGFLRPKEYNLDPYRKDLPS